MANFLTHCSWLERFVGWYNQFTNQHLTSKWCLIKAQLVKSFKRKSITNGQAKFQFRSLKVSFNERTRNSTFFLLDLFRKTSFLGEFSSPSFRSEITAGKQNNTSFNPTRDFPEWTPTFQTLIYFLVYGFKFFSSSLKTLEMANLMPKSLETLKPWTP